MMRERVCRAGVILIVLFAIVDPAWVVARVVPQRVVVSRTSGATAADVERVTAALAGAFEVESTETPSTAAHIIVGRRAPESHPDRLTFVVTPGPSPDVPEFRRVAVRDELFLDATGRVTVDIAVPPSSAGRQMAVTLSADGMPADRQIVSVAAGVSAITTDLIFVPARTGLARLRVSARLDDGPVAEVDAATEVTRRTFRVLSYEARPSWAGTFLRRTLEEDPRFEVVVRSITSRGVSAEAGASPATLDRADELAGFDLVVVSAPEALGQRAAAALVSYLRDREGAVVIVPGDVEADVLSRLTGVESWTIERRPALERVEAASGGWTASEFLWPGQWPRGAEALTGCLAPGRCAVWRVPVGGGRVVISSALDGWRTRVADSSRFVAFWQSLAADEAANTPRAVEISLQSRLVETTALVPAEVVVSGNEVPRAEWQDIHGGATPVRLWPAGARRYAAQFHAPAVPGRYRLVVTTDEVARAEFMVVESGDVHPTLPAHTETLSALASSRGGTVVPMAELDTLATRLAATAPSTRVEVPTNPMQSPFWMMPFAGLLAIEWWSRRRRGAR